ncbi:succinylglutamate desuccinylase/aspartoacylase family protein [Bosea sp. CS1GBMeth4]|uniref:succinylglutamate desuccinylase/aspartoacylase family protein n=1 Tax=Bosea sp. CS1GBMeth4 TaxID=1892849 RepID=UPI001647D7B7|nr:succinylglutamate desuccinylase/aspartoacylase family protein [Bosea sp. CS1GBMeth4]
MTATDLDDGPLEAVRFIGLRPGPRLIVTGAVHGNEPCGPAAIRRAIEECRTGTIRILRGEVTFLPVTNPKAFRQKTREGDRNLNRDLRERPLPGDFEDRIGNPICALLRQHDALLDIHSFRQEGEPFVFFGPANNRGALEPFARAEEELALAACLGVSTAIHGWLDNYARLLDIRARLPVPRLNVTEGYGTTEFMRFCGGYAVTLECGQHDDPRAADVGYAAIRNTLAQLQLVDAPLPPPALRDVIEMVEVLLCETEGDRAEAGWRTGDAVRAGAVLARRADGAKVTAPSDGYIIFPNVAPRLGEAICHFGVASSRRIAG